MKKVLLSLAGLALLVPGIAGCGGEGGLGKMLTYEVPHKPFVTNPILMDEFSKAALDEMDKYKEDGKVEHLENAYNFFLDVGNVPSALNCAKIVIKKPEYVNKGRLMMRQLEGYMPSVQEMRSQDKSSVR
jgi:hypothetical protein